MKSGGKKSKRQMDRKRPQWDRIRGERLGKRLADERDPSAVKGSPVRLESIAFRHRERFVRYVVRDLDAAVAHLKSSLSEWIDATTADEAQVRKRSGINKSKGHHHYGPVERERLVTATIASANAVEIMADAVIEAAKKAQRYLDSMDRVPAKPSPDVS